MTKEERYTFCYCPVCEMGYTIDDLQKLEENFEDCLMAGTLKVVCLKCGALLNLDAYTDWVLTRRKEK